MPDRSLRSSPPPGGVRRLVVILDGTMSSLAPGRETNPGLIYRLLTQTRCGLYYEPGIQYTRLSEVMNVIEGRGINRQIRRAYGWIASHWRPGDQLWIFGFSRGAYAVRALAGVIDRVGLLRSHAATERNVHLAYRHYRTLPDSHATLGFRARFCHHPVPIEMIGAFDTVKAIGVRSAALGRWSTMAHRFHDYAPSSNVALACHALARDEQRAAYAPVMWRVPEGWPGRCAQIWFTGTHGDVGGQLSGIASARKLSNVPLVWMLEQAEGAGLPLPEAWRERFPCDADAPSIGMNLGFGRLLRTRAPREIGLDSSEAPFAMPPAAP